MPCRILARGTMNAYLIEIPDGTRVGIGSLVRGRAPIRLEIDELVVKEFTAPVGKDDRYY